MARNKNLRMWINKENEMPEREEVFELFCSGFRIMDIEAEEMIQLLRKHLLLLQRTKVSFPAPMSGSSQSLITRVQGNLTIYFDLPIHSHTLT